MSVLPGADMEGTTFEEAFQLLEEVDQALLEEYERDLWDDERRKFVFGTELVSVLDCVTSSGDCVRLLLQNRDPRLAQTAVPIREVGARSPPLPALPPLFGQFGSHLGGLALAAAAWRAAQGLPRADPRVLVLGGGGAAVPRTIAAALPHAAVEVVELCEDTRAAARALFGLAELEARPRGGAFRLRGGCGAARLLAAADASVDVLIVDAAAEGLGGLHAPPPPFRSRDFWRAVARAAAPGAVVALNLVGGREETEALRELVSQELRGWGLLCLPPPPGGMADALHLDQRLLFAAAGPLAGADQLARAGLSGTACALVDEPGAWLEHWQRHSER